MKFTIENIGSVQKSEMVFGRLTILCGKNNTGKTYITYNTFNFLDAIHFFVRIPVDKEKAATLLKMGKVSIDLSEYYDNYPVVFKNIMDEWVKQQAARQMAAQKDFFSRTVMNLDFEHDAFKKSVQQMVFDATPLVTSDCLLRIKKESYDNHVDFTILNSGKELPDVDLLHEHIIFALSYILNSYFPDAFIITCERTGVACFRPSFVAPQKKIAKLEQKDHYEEDAPRYPRPMQKDWRFVVEFKDASIEKSYIAEKHPYIIDYLSEICGGEYNLDNNNVLFRPKDAQETLLTTTESSSSVRSLMELNFYLKHKAKRHQVLIVDEPELNLHPENQRKIARLLAMIVNAGIYVAITTHSDYIIREFNTLIMLHDSSNKRLKAIAQNCKFDEKHLNCLLDPNIIKSYVAENGTVKQMNISSKYGIEVTSFDNTINEVNRLQRQILYGE